MAIVVRRKKDGGASYQVKVKDRAGAWFPTSTFESQEDAMAEQLRLMKLKRKGAQAISNDARTVTLREYWEVWSVENRQDVSAGWRLSQDQMWRAYIDPALGDSKMIDIGKPQIGRVLNAMRDLGRSPQTIQHVYNLLHRMFGDAVGYYEMLAVSPVHPDHHRPRVPKKKRNFLAPVDAWKLLEHSRKTVYGPAVWLQILAALRPSEVQALRWRSVHFKSGQILICAAFNRKVGQLQDYPKQEDWDYSPMAPRLAEYLRPRAGATDDFVVPGPRGGMLVYATYNKALKRLCREAGVMEMEPHELRHTSTEIWANAGASTEDIRRLLNHKSLTSTKGYIHRTDDRLNQLGRSIEVQRETQEAVSQNGSHLGNSTRVDSQEEIRHAF